MLEYIIIIIILYIILLIVIKSGQKDFHLNINKLVELLGGKDNILDSTYNMSRFIVTLKNIDLIDRDAIQKLGAKGIVVIDNKVKIILGKQSKDLKKYIDEIK